MNATELTDEDRLIAAVKQYMELLDSGEAPSHDEFLCQYPDIDDDLRLSLKGLALVHSAAGPRGSSRTSSQSSAAEFEIADKPIGDFQIVREIGRGGMGVVYEAMQLSLNRRVALKVLPLASGLDEVRLQRFRNEANAAATLHHTNIVPVYAVGSDRGVHFYAMQLIDGISLAELLNAVKESNVKDPRHFETIVVENPNAQRQDSTDSHSESPALVEGSGSDLWSQSQRETAAKYSTRLDTTAAKQTDYYRSVVRMMHQAALAIDHAHEYGVIHRDLKPANLLLDSAGKIWVADFGLAQVQTEHSNLTRTGDPLGTLRYMSPEQATGRRGELDHRTDIYSLGVTLYELLTLQPAIAEGDFHEMLNRVAFVEPPAPRSIVPNLPVELDTIVRKAAAKIPSERYATAGELANDLQAWLDDKPITAKPPRLLERMAKWRRRNSGVVAAASAVLLLATIGLATTTMVVWNQKQQTSNALESETEQRKLAEERFELARHAVDTFSRLSETELSHRGNMQDLRRSFLETSMSFYQEFLDQQADDSELSSELLATRDRVRQAMEELRILDSLESLALIHDERVIREIELSPEIAAAVLESIDQFDRQREALENQFIGGIQDENVELTDLLKQLDQSTQKLLSQGQQERLRQIARRLRLPFTFKSSEVIRELALTTEQVERIDQITAETAPHHPRDPRGGRSPHGGPNGRRGGPGREGPGIGGPPRFAGPPHSEEIATATERTVRQIMKVLTPQQRKTWNTLAGEPFP